MHAILPPQIPPRRVRWVKMAWALLALLNLVSFGGTVWTTDRFSDDLPARLHYGLLLCVGTLVLPSVALYGLDVADPYTSLLVDIFVGVANLSFVLLPISIAVAIFRYRLWDIDVIIRKTLAYSFLTAVLALVFFGSITLLQSAVSAVSGQQSAVVTVLSTLLIAALFTPLRLRVQSLIDRRFYRQKYDAQQVLARFAITARDETDLDRLTGELAAIVTQSMQPEGLHVWLRQNHG